MCVLQQNRFFFLPSSFCTYPLLAVCICQQISEYVRRPEQKKEKKKKKHIHALTHQFRTAIYIYVYCVGPTKSFNIVQQQQQQQHHSMWRSISFKRNPNQPTKFLIKRKIDVESKSFIHFFSPSKTILMGVFCTHKSVVSEEGGSCYNNVAVCVCVFFISLKLIWFMNL